MKVLSLIQPWATLVVIGAKQIETRSWTTKHRGKLLIHASCSKAGKDFASLLPISKYIPAFDVLPFGAIIGEVTLTDVVRTEALTGSPSFIEQLTLEEQAFGDYTAGRYAWLLEDAVAYEEPIPARGYPGLWSWE